MVARSVESASSIGKHFLVHGTPQTRYGSHVQRQAEAEIVDYEDTATALRGIKVLLADDVEVNLEVAQLLLHGVGPQVDSARNGREAVDKARITAYDLILMDVQMPVMNGLEATQAIRQLSGRSETPFWRGHVNVGHVQGGFVQVRMNDFIAKPVDPGRISTAIRSLVARDTAGWGASLANPDSTRAPGSACNGRSAGWQIFRASTSKTVWHACANEENSPK